VLSQRNAEVRKQNAQKHLLFAQINQKPISSNYKKQRSKSCLNRTDNTLNQAAAKKRREKSFVLEMRDLKKEIDDEIKREMIEGKFENGPTSA